MKTKKKELGGGSISDVLDMISDGFIMLDRSFCYTYVNRKIVKMTGIEAEELIGKCIWDVFPDITGTATFLAIHTAMNEQRYVSNTDYYAPLDLWQENHIYPAQEGLSIFIRDISAFKKAEKEINESEKKYRDLFDHSPLPLWIYDTASLRFLEVNRAAIHHYGYSREEFLSMTLLDIRTKKNAEELKQFFIHSQFDGKSIWEHLKKNGEPIFVEVNSHTIRYNNLNARLVSVNDITFKKSFEEELKNSEARYRRIVETAQEGIWTIDKRNKTNFVNKKICELLEYESCEMIGKDFYNFMDEEEKKIAAVSLAKGKKEENYRFDFKFISKKGNTVWTSIATNPIKDDEGKYQGTLAMITDITERKKAEIELTQANEQLHQLTAHLQSVREEERTSIAREIHDELGQQLTGIKIQISHLKKDIAEDCTLRHKPDEIISMVNTAIKTVRKIVTELRPGILDDLGLEAAIEWQGKEFEKQSGVHCHLQSKLVHESFSQEIKTTVFRIFQESLTNVARHAQATQVSVQLVENTNSIVLQVTDNGKGISEQEKNNRISFGLLGMKERAAILNGEFSIQPLKEGGTRVILKIPL